MVEGAQQSEMEIEGGHTPAGSAANAVGDSGTSRDPGTSTTVAPVLGIADAAPIPRK